MTDVFPVDEFDVPAPQARVFAKRLGFRSAVLGNLAAEACFLNVACELGRFSRVANVSFETPATAIPSDTPDPFGGLFKVRVAKHVEVGSVRIVVWPSNRREHNPPALTLDIVREKKTGYGPNPEPFDFRIEVKGPVIKGRLTIAVGNSSPSVTVNSVYDPVTIKREGQLVIVTIG